MSSKGPSGAPATERRFKVARVTLSGSRGKVFSGNKVTTRTVAKMKYTTLRGKSGKISKAAVDKIKASARYYSHRPDHTGERTHRGAFNHHENDIDTHNAAKKIELEAEKWDYSYRMVLSPGEEMNKAEIEEWTRNVMDQTGLSNSHYIAFAHAGEDRHTEHDHVHVICFTNEKLTRLDLQVIRQLGDLEAEQDGVRRALIQEWRECNEKFWEHERQPEYIQPTKETVLQKYMEFD